MTSLSDVQPVPEHVSSMYALSVEVFPVQTLPGFVLVPPDVTQSVACDGNTRDISADRRGWVWV